MTKEDLTTLAARGFMHSKDRVSFLSKLGHELKSPIHGIRGVSSYLEENWDTLDEKSKKTCIQTIAETSENLFKIAESLVDPKNEKEDITFNFAEFDLVKLTDQIVKNCQNLNISRPEISINMKSKLSECVAMVDSFWYGQLLVNLISNAVNYSDKGQILVTLSLENIEGMEVCKISVKDQGVGIPEEDLQKIFAPYDRGSMEHSYKGGTGLGLAISKEVAEAHGGKISAFNNADVGSTVEFYIPIKK